MSDASEQPEAAILKMWHPATLGEIRCHPLRHGKRRIEVVMRDNKEGIWSHYMDLPRDVDSLPIVFDAVQECLRQLCLRMQQHMR